MAFKKAYWRLINIFDFFLILKIRQETKLGNHGVIDPPRLPQIKHIEKLYKFASPLHYILITQELFYVKDIILLEFSFLVVTSCT